MTRVNIITSGIKSLEQSPEVAALMGEQADDVKSRVRAPSKMDISSRHGVGPRGAFSQVIMRGDGALAIEFGSRNNAPIAPLRRALRGS